MSDVIEDTTREAVLAALEVLDDRWPDGRKSKGPLGDKLAHDLHELISKAIEEHATVDDGLTIEQWLAQERNKRHDEWLLSQKSD